MDPEEMLIMDPDEDEVALLVAALIDDSSDDDIDGGGKEEGIDVDKEGFRTMSNASFKANYRMDRVVFQKLIVVVGLHMRRTNRLQRLCTPVDRILLMGLWPLFNPDTFRSTSLHHGVKRAGIHDHYKVVVEVLSELDLKYVKWPDALERDYISRQFERRYGYLGAVGCIDGVHIEITAPLENPINHLNRHHSYSILVQAVCDHRMLYRDVYIGNPGAIGDVRNYNNSPLSLNVLTNPDMFSEGEHLLGDGAYTLTDKMMIPYADTGNIEAWMRTHNAILSSCRVKIENSFARLRGTNRRLKKLPMRNPYLLRYHITACFVLHYFILLEGNECEGFPPTVPPAIPEIEYNRLNNEARNLGAVKREYIANILHPHH